MAEARLTKDTDVITQITPAAGYAAGQVIQLADGRAAFITGLNARVSGDQAGHKTSGQVTLTKSASVVVLKGGRIYWDRSTNSATPLAAAAGADFFVGVAIEDVAAATLTVTVDLNKQPSYLVELHRDAFDTAIVAAAGSPTLSMRGGQAYLAFDTTAEAQKLDLLSKRSVPLATPMILEAKFSVQTAADADVADINIGLASATHAADADSIAESAFIHQDSGADLNIDCESDDGSNETAATDSAVDLVADGTEVEIWIDCRVSSALKFYINGVAVLASTTFNISDGSGPLKALCHYEKSANDSAGEIRLSHMAIRTTDLAS